VFREHQNQALGRAPPQQTWRNRLMRQLVWSFEEEMVLDSGEEETKENPQGLRPPVVTVMATWTRKTVCLTPPGKRTSPEGDGRITQHIGAYKVQVKGRSVVFVDTRHESVHAHARARREVTDIVVGWWPRRRASCRRRAKAMTTPSRECADYCGGEPRLINRKRSRSGEAQLRIWG